MLSSTKLVISTTSALAGRSTDSSSFCVVFHISMTTGNSVLVGTFFELLEITAVDTSSSLLRYEIAP